MAVTQQLLASYKAAAAGPFSPLDVALTMVGWWNPDVGVFQTAGGSAATSDADPVGEMQDQSGNARHMAQTTAGRRPTLKLATHNSKNTLLWDGVDDRMATASITHGVGTGDFWWITCVKIGTGNPAKAYFANGDFSPSFFRSSISAKLAVDFGTSGTFNTDLTVGSFYVVELMRTGTTVKAFVNGVQEATTYTRNTSMANGASRLGDDDGTGFILNNSNQGQTLFYAGTPTAGDREDLIDYLGAYYEVTVNP